MFSEFENRLNIIKAAHLGGVSIGGYFRNPFPVKVDPVERLIVSRENAVAFTRSAVLTFDEKKAKQFASRLVEEGKISREQVLMVIKGRGILRPA
ncbi:MAG: hypothetical protein AUJ23_00145 [Candidatus Magasanikbacteria bacterium CG1_02_32_51]|uniref:Uncharacterized protein n=1 Tax=Candidatus Magasanikbacteria bacterium CG1_02_32_51 TaxID=1805238 RepID=A0A1J4U7A3_9BACT|nr:MAG: hypothetical protein AUJ23_00145 [Candidatus Magasanikbacteria bacterium CG1_02_32_51]